jgi:hypothetical protein
MVPAAFVRLELLPLTPNGKVDRKTLPQPETVNGPSKAEHNPPGELEAAVARMWEDVLGLQGPGLDANFFDIGGHSLLIIHLHQRMVTQMAVAFDVLDLFRHPTVRQQAALIAGEGNHRDVRAAANAQAARQRQGFTRQRALQAGRGRNERNG